MIEYSEVIISNALMKGMKVLTIISSPVKEDTGIIIMGENMDVDYQADELSVIRLYLLNKQDSKFHIVNELEAFAFHNLESALNFLAELPNMSALELLIMMKGMHNDSGGNERDSDLLH